MVKKQGKPTYKGTRAKRLAKSLGAQSAGIDRASRHRIRSVSRTSERIIREISSRRRTAMKVLANR